jgi:hypothetical protein
MSGYSVWQSDSARECPSDSVPPSGLPGSGESHPNGDLILASPPSTNADPRGDPASGFHTSPDAGTRPNATSDSFILSNLGCGRSIDSIEMPDHRSVREFLAEDHAAAEIAAISADGIRREGNRCLVGQIDRDHGQQMRGELVKCDTLQSIVRLCAQFYTRNSFLYPRVNRYLREPDHADVETGRNLGLYIGLLRESSCVWHRQSPVSWHHPKAVYRGASLPPDVIIDYARHAIQAVRWQGFTSSSTSVEVALRFQRNALFEISLQHPVASPAEISAFQAEQEFIVNLYQWFKINTVGWNEQYQRWILSVIEISESAVSASWLSHSDWPFSQFASPE